PQIQMPMMSGNGMAGNGMAGNGGGMSGNMSQRDRGDILKDSAITGDTAKVADVASVASVASVAQVAQVAHVAAPVQPMVIGAQMPQTVQAASGTDAADKVGKLLDARDAAPAQPLSQVTLNVDNAAGGSDKITVQLRAGVVDTAISVADPNRADKMSLRVGELQHAWSSTDWMRQPSTWHPRRLAQGRDGTRAKAAIRAPRTGALRSITGTTDRTRMRPDSALVESSREEDRNDYRAHWRHRPDA